MWEIIATIALPVFKFIYDKIQGRKLSDEEFVAMVLAHRTQRQGAGQTVIDWKESLRKLKEEQSKKKEQ